MVTQHIVLDMTPGTKPIVNVSQYDTGARTLVFHLRQNRQTFTPPDGCTGILHGIKPDSTYFSYSVEIEGDTVVADCTEQMTACVGFAECEVRFSNTEGHVGSANFLLNCEKSPMTGAVISESVIAAAEQLTDRAEQAASSATASATAASASAEAAAESASAASTSETNAAASATAASTSAEEAGASATAAANSASSASGSEASARQYSAAAEGFATDAENSAQGAAQDAQAASAKALEAAASADRASGSAVDSATAANLASGYADTARQQAQAAEVSATNAAGSASTASQAAATATTKAGEASDSATAAGTSASQAASSASAASASAGNASASATAASESATAASGSASAAAGSAADASSSAAAALASEQAAAESARTLTIDPTLTQPGQAAEAKATGDAIAEAKNAIDNETLFTSVEYNPFNAAYWGVGYISPTTGANASATKYIRLNTNHYINTIDGATYLKANTGYSFWVYAYEQDGTYVGAWNGKTFEKTWQYINVTEFNLLKFETLYKYRVFMGRDDEADMSASEYTNLIIYYTRTASDGYRGVMRNSNLADDTTKVSGYLSSNGGIAGATEQSSRETTTDFIPVNSGETYTLQLYTHKSVTFWCRICGYDENKNYVTRWDHTVSTIMKTWRDFNYALYQITIPTNVTYIRVSQRYGFCMVTKGVTEWDYMPSPFDVVNHWNLRPKQDYFVRTVNHRGYGRVAPENTAPAFELSADLGFWGVENDIRFTSDGVPVLLHDETINRTARNSDGTEISGDVYISQITYAQALTYDFGVWMGEKYKGTKIMTFEEFVSLCRKKSLNIYNEIKAGTESQVASLVQTVKRYGMQKHCTWISFSSTYLEQVCRYDIGARIGLIFSEFGQNDISALTMLQTDTNTVFADISISNNTTLNNAVIDAMINTDIELEMYTPNFISVMTSLNPYVTGVTSDWLIAGDVLYTGRNDIMVFDS